MTILRYGDFDTGNPQSELGANTVYGFCAWYENDRYGLNLTAWDVEKAI